MQFLYMFLSLMVKEVIECIVECSRFPVVFSSLLFPAGILGIISKSVLLFLLVHIHKMAWKIDLFGFCICLACCSLSLCLPGTRSCSCLPVLLIVYLLRLNGIHCSRWKIKQNVDIIATVVWHETSNLDVLHNEKVTYKLIRDKSVKILYARRALWQKSIENPNFQKANRLVNTSKTKSVAIWFLLYIINEKWCITNICFWRNIFDHLKTNYGCVFANWISYFTNVALFKDVNQ